MIVPCIICNKELTEVGYTENQPSDGVCAIIHGNYGSTVFDPFDGTHIEINICDECLVHSGEQGYVLSGRRTRPVTLAGYHIGYERLDRPLVPWHKGLPGYDDKCVIDEDDLGRLPETVVIDQEALRLARILITEDDAT